MQYKKSMFWHCIEMTVFCPPYEIRKTTFWWRLQQILVLLLFQLFFFARWAIKKFNAEDQHKQTFYNIFKNIYFTDVGILILEIWPTTDSLCSNSSHICWNLSFSSFISLILKIKTIYIKNLISLESRQISLANLGNKLWLNLSQYNLIVSLDPVSKIKLEAQSVWVPNICTTMDYRNLNVSLSDKLIKQCKAIKCIR